MCLSSPCPHRALSCCFASPCTNLPKCQIAPGAGKVSLSLPQLLFSLLRSAFSPSFHPLWCFAIFASRRFFPTDLKPCRLSAGINSVLCAVNSQTAPVAVAVAAPPCRAPLTLPAQPSLLSMNPRKEHGVLRTEISPHFFARLFYTLPGFHRPSPGSDHIECQSGNG